MTTGLGIDHPLIAVNDIGAARQCYQALGFALRPTSQHPWGTSTVLAVFRRQLLELVSIGDDSLLDGYATGDFRFGRHVARHLAQRQGVALTALYSGDALGDAARIAARGGELVGSIEFGRQVTNAQGQPDRTATTLAILRRKGLDRLTMFACQQHRRDLIEDSAWMQHPNGVRAIASATILAAAGDLDAVRDWLQTLQGTVATDNHWGFTIATGNGVWRVIRREMAHHLFGPIPPQLAADGAASVVSLDFVMRDRATLMPFVRDGEFLHRDIDDQIVLTQVDRLGGVLLTFQEG